MKVMTFNLRSDSILDVNNRWNDRSHIVYNLIKEHPCDIIGLQEVSNGMYNDIYENMKDYHIVGMGRTKKLFAEKNNILISKRHKILKHETVWLSGTPKKQGSSIWYSLFPRICTTALVELENKFRLRIYNTHLDCLLPYARQYGLERIAELMKKHQDKEKLPCILMGDFNATPNSKVIQKFSSGTYSGKKFVAVQEASKELYQKSTMSMFKGRQKGMHIDYIFVCEAFKIKDVHIVRYNEADKYPSDHYPLVTDLQVLENIR